MELSPQKNTPQMSRKTALLRGFIILYLLFLFSDGMVVAHYASLYAVHIFGTYKGWVKPHIAFFRGVKVTM